MAGKFNFYGIFKRWTARDSAQTNTSYANSFELQPANLLPIFNTSSNQFASVYFKVETSQEPGQLTDLVQKCLRNLNYWHCHGRAIRCILPTNYEQLLEESSIQQIEKMLLKSKFPVGLINIGIQTLNQSNFHAIENNLHLLHRLGISFEILNHSELSQNLNWIPRKLIKGIHLPISLLRNAYQDKNNLKQLHQFIEITNANNFHKYCGDIGLVHDLTFARNVGIEFGYGPLMMNTVSVHQILKIKESQFANFQNNPTPSLNRDDGEHR